MHSPVLAKDVRVAADQLVADGAQRVGDAEGASIGRDLREEDAFENVVADLFAKRLEIVVLDGLDDFVRFLEDELAQRLKRLLAIPRTAVRGSQGRHDLDKARELFGRGGLRHWVIG